MDVYQQIFLEREYSCLDQYATSGLIIDCGANAGYSASYLLSRYPQATLIAVEPDEGNFRVLQANVARFGARVRTIRAGVWSHPCGLNIERGGHGDGREWSIWVRESRPGEAADIEAVDIQSLLSSSGFPRISILKMDIERSERAVFSSGYEAWVSLCDAIVIELHDRECEEVFFRAIRSQAFTISRHGELTVCIRPAPRS